MRRGARHGFAVGYAVGRGAGSRGGIGTPYGIPITPAPVATTHVIDNHHPTVVPNTNSGSGTGGNIVRDVAVVGGVSYAAHKFRKQKKDERKTTPEDKKQIRTVRERRRAIKLWDRRLCGQITDFGKGILVVVLWRTKFVSDLVLKVFKPSASKFTFSGLYKDGRRYSAVWLDGEHQGLFHISVSLREEIDLYHWKKASPLIVVYDCSTEKMASQSSHKPSPHHHHPPMGRFPEKKSPEDELIGKRRFSRFIFAHGRALQVKQQHHSFWLAGTFMMSQNTSQKKGQTSNRKTNLRWWHRYRQISNEIPSDWPYETPLLDENKYSSGEEKYSNSSSCDSSSSSIGDPDTFSPTTSTLPPSNPPSYTDVC